MMKRTLYILIAALLAAGANAPAHAERLVTSLSTHRVLISSNFTGTQLVLFASIEDSDATREKPKKYDVVITVRGPASTFVTRKKERVLGLWVNWSSHTFNEAPSYLAVLTNRPPSDFGPPAFLNKYRIGLNFAAFAASDQMPLATDEEFRDGFIRVRKQAGLFLEEANGVTFLAPTLFRANVPIPGTAPIGPYEVEAQVFLNGALVAQQSTAIEVVKSGFEAFIAQTARESRLDYGIGVAILACTVGLFAAFALRRS
ncbi:MAG TPA: TIGR02186 family protein [Xanthobacteraceae bacterium]|nr:TIGR02186 family protein [Xanthobacteraceae bacterium]